MNLENGETKIVNTGSHGDVKVTNHNDESLHCRWGEGVREEKGFIILASGVMSNVSQGLIAAVLEALE